jgi:hypothetical protein
MIFFLGRLTRPRDDVTNFLPKYYAVPANDIPTIRTGSDDMMYKITSYELRVELLLLNCLLLLRYCDGLSPWLPACRNLARVGASALTVTQTCSVVRFPQG